MRRLLYLGFAFPPGVASAFPEVIPAGHGFETALITALGRHFEIQSVGLLPTAEADLPPTRDHSPGLPHQLLLVDQAPELFHRWRSARRLRRWYQELVRACWQPDAILVYNLPPVFNDFIRWLHRQPARPATVLLLADSSTLGRRLSFTKRLRYQCKPMIWPDEVMLPFFDACVGLGRDTERFFAPRKTPWLWLPGACDPADAPPWQPPSHVGPIRFGYFGALAGHSGVMELARTFLAANLPATLHVCGYGKLAADLRALAASDPRLKFDGLLPRPTDCLTWAQNLDVLVNPRPAGCGNENNFPSKLFSYALTGRAILTSRLSGTDEVLGEAADYFDPQDFSRALARQLRALAAQPRPGLAERGRALRERIMANYTWSHASVRLAGFIAQTLAAPPSGRHAGRPLPGAVSGT
ncbi:hypothetical protein LBMAG56_46660 [Verrucomicrobiota bacterium]|nr:hypothetical protein LBMAG56_46660 [Verrucomicrobiota bacterium]